MLIEKAKRDALSGKPLGRETVEALLSIPEDSPECDALGLAARQAAQEICKGRAYLWGAVGLDFKPCPLNCRFCSLGEAWGLTGQGRELSEAEIIGAVSAYAQQQVRWIVLRTTEYYSLERLGQLINRIRAEVPGAYELGLNAGEMDEGKAAALSAIGCDFMYHSLRLREGADTNFPPDVRLKTLAAVQKSPADLVFLVEPVGREHSNAELAEAMETVLTYGASVSGAMARVPVPGTPLGDIPQVSERRLAQIIAVTRLAFGYRIPDICVHPASRTAMEWGANVAVLETGSVPRDTGACDGAWHGFHSALAVKWFEDAGYQVCVPGRRAKEQKNDTAMSL